MRIGIDVDGVLADFNKSFIERVIEVTGQDKFPPRPFDIPTWDYPQFYGYSNKQCSEVWKSIKKDSMFWRRLTSYEGTFKFLFDLHELKEDTYFITSRPGIDAKYQTERWLKSYGWPDSNPTVLISSKKGKCVEALDLTHYIDDKTENCEDVRDSQPSCQVFMLSRPWNAPTHSVPRTPDLLTFMEALQNVHQTANLLKEL